jgi:hypothetical protein
MVSLWESKKPVWETSIALRRGSPYTSFMKNQIVHMTERGNLHQILTQFSLKKPNCKPLKIKGIDHWGS